MKTIVPLFEEDFNFHRWLVYLGNKRKLLPQILSSVQSCCKQGKILDLFSGSGVVSGFLRYHGYTVHANDIAPYSQIINEAMLGLTSVPENFDELIKKVNALTTPSPGYEYFSKYFSEDSSCGKERKFYTKRNGLFIDAVLEYLEKMNDTRLANIIKADLLVKMSRHVNTSGVFIAHKKFGTSKGICLNRIMHPISIEAPVIFQGPVGVSTQMDAIDCLNKSNDLYDVIYMDPPYNARQYAVYYHLLEYACVPLSLRFIPSNDQVSGVDPTLYKSPYCKAKECSKELEQLFELAVKRTKALIVSYNDDGLISKEEMLKTLGQHWSVHTRTLKYRKYWVQSKECETSKVNEYLFCCSPRT